MEGKIIILDDEAELRALLQRYLGSNGLTVRSAEDAEQLDRLLAREPFDALILDLMMPGEDGLSICRRLRARGETIPILMLTAKGDPVDRIIGLEMGADDYLPKPFDPRELLARLHAMLRRQEMAGAVPAAQRNGRVNFGPFVLDLAARQLARNGDPVPLTSAEYAVLAALAMHPGRPLGRERLRTLAHGRDHEATERSVDVQVLRLRRLIEEDPSSPRYIQTVWGIGYLFAPDGSARNDAGGQPAN
ncbi:two-component system response regulator OmpR [Propionivibrio soli]|uniref:osmolarity response regulator transcription factor OmpR n=1 Tax=Propionivibrio soli TaxID=2976531 RepID=UPI0021E753A0|nr:two-component system response regulator OmpR [Propionivibrio soli]